MRGSPTGDPALEKERGMLQVRDTVAISTTRERAFDYMTDPANWPAWDTAMVHVASTSERLRKGSLVEGVSKLGGRKRPWKVEVVEHERPSRFAIRSVTPDLPFEMTWTLREPRPGYTEIDLEESTPGVGGILDMLPNRLQQWLLQKDAGKASARLKGALEKV